MKQSKTAPLTLEVLSIRFLNLPTADYILEVATDGVRMRRKGTSRWIGPVSFEQILSACARKDDKRDGKGEPWARA